MPRRGSGGFTLVEILVVMAIIAIIASGVGAFVVHAGRRARPVRARAEIGLITMALEKYHLSFRTFPPDTGYGLDMEGSPGTYDAGSLWRYLAMPVTDPLTKRSHGPFLEEWSAERLESYTDAQAGPSFYLIDPWGNPYGFVGDRRRVIHNAASFDLFSPGPGRTTACEKDGAAPNKAYNGIDDDGNGIVDDASEFGPDAHLNGTEADDINNWSSGG